MKQYIDRVVAGEAIESFLNEMAQQGYVLLNIQPVARRIRDTEEGTEELAINFLIVMERTVERAEYKEMK